MTVKHRTIGFANSFIAIACSLSLMSAAACSPQVIVVAKDNSYRTKISKDVPGKSPEAVVIDASANSPPTAEIALKSNGYHHIEIEFANGKKLADFNMELYGQQKTRINITQAEVLLETQPSRFSISSTPALLYGGASVLFFAMGGGILGSTDSTLAKRGMCTELPVPPATQCREIYIAQDASRIRNAGYLSIGFGVAFLGASLGFAISDLRKKAKNPWSPIMRLATGGLNP